MSTSEVQVNLGDEGSIMIQLCDLEKIAGACTLMQWGSWQSMACPLPGGASAMVDADGVSLSGKNGGSAHISREQVQKWIHELREDDEAPIQRFEVQGDAVIDHRDVRGSFPREVARVGGHLEWWLDAQSEEFDLDAFKLEVARTREAVGAFFVAFLGSDAPERVDASKTLRSVD